MSSVLPQVQPQEPALFVYPNTPMTSHTPSSHSNGSFGTAFVVLSVIIVVSAIACCIGRMCSGKGKNKNKNKNNQKPDKNGQLSSSLGPKEKKSMDHNFMDGDIEFGFEKGFPTMRSGPVRSGDPRGFKPPGPFKGSRNGQSKVVSFNPVLDTNAGPI